MRILRALIRKEFKQIVRDPSSIIVAFVIPLILIFLFAFAINLDTSAIKVGIVKEDNSPQVNNLIMAFEGSRYFDIKILNDRKTAQKLLTAGKIRAFIVIPTDFSRKFQDVNSTAQLQLITDGAEPNISMYAKNYAGMAILNMQAQQMFETAESAPEMVNLIPRFWYNQDLKSRYVILPGSIAVVMTLIGAILTALVVAREWERGTMEAILSTRVRKIDFLLSKYVCYYVLGMCSVAFCMFLINIVFQVPFKGSLFFMFVTSSLFLLSALGQGLLISTLFRNQFLASIAALLSSFMPALLLSGLIYEISSMPKFIQAVTVIIPAKYFVGCLSSLFLTGNVYHILLVESIYLGIFSVVMFIAVYKMTKTRLDQ